MSPRSYLGRGLYLRPFTAPVRPTPHPTSRAPLAPALTFTPTFTLALAPPSP